MNNITLFFKETNLQLYLLVSFFSVLYLSSFQWLLLPLVFQPVQLQAGCSRQAASIYSVFHTRRASKSSLSRGTFQYIITALKASGHIQTGRCASITDDSEREKNSDRFPQLVLIKITVSSPFNKLHFGVKWNSGTSSTYFTSIFLISAQHWWTVSSKKIFKSL